MFDYQYIQHVMTSKARARCLGLALFDVVSETSFGWMSLPFGAFGKVAWPREKRIPFKAESNLHGYRQWTAGFKFQS
jgi:hypothetical protein